MSTEETKTTQDLSSKGRITRARGRYKTTIIGHVDYPLTHLTREQAALVGSALLALAVDLEYSNPKLESCTYSDNGYVKVQFTEHTSLTWLHKVLRHLKLWEGCNLKVFSKKPILKEATHIYNGNFPDGLCKKAYEILKSIGNQNALIVEKWVVLKIEKNVRTKVANVTFITDEETANKIDELNRKLLYESGTVQLEKIDPEELRKGVWPKPVDKKKDLIKDDASKDSNSKSNPNVNSNFPGNGSINGSNGGNYNVSVDGVPIGNRNWNGTPFIGPNRLGSGGNFPNGGNSFYPRFGRNYSSGGGGKWPPSYPYSMPWVGDGSYMYDRRAIYGPGPIPSGRSNSNQFYIGHENWPINDRGDDQFWKD